MGSSNLLIVEPNHLFRDGLRQIFLNSSYHVVGAVRTVAEAFGTTGVEPDLVIWGTGASLHFSVEMARVREHYAPPCCVRCVLLADVSNVVRLRRFVETGVDAVLSQDISSDVLHRSLDLVMLGQQLYPASLVHAPVEYPPAFEAELIPFPILPGARPASRSDERHGEAALSPRDNQILRCLTQGASNKTIARELSISEDAVKAHVKGLLRRVHARNRTQAAVWAMANMQDGPAVEAHAGDAQRRSSRS